MESKIENDDRYAIIFSISKTFIAAQLITKGSSIDN